MGQWYGCPATPANQSSQTTANYTYATVTSVGTCPVAGSVTKIECYVYATGTFDFATFGASGSTFTDKTFALGVVIGTTGYHLLEAPGHFTAFDIAIGDFIGCYSSSGRLDRDDGTGWGYHYDSGDQIGDSGGSTFTHSDTSRDIQLRFWIETGTLFEETPSDSFTLQDAASYGYTPGLPGVAWGEENPGGTVSGISWTTWQKSTGVNEQVIGDIDWGQLNTYDFIHVSNVYDTELTSTANFQISTNSWQAGSGSGTLYIRGDTSSFLWDDGSPSWIETTTASSLDDRDWRYLQLKVEHTA